MKKKFISILLCFTMIMSLTAFLASCGGKEASGKTGAEDGKIGEAEEVVTLKVGMIGKDIKTACIIIAEELGYFDEAGIDVQFEKINSLPDGLTAVSLDKLDIPALWFYSELQLHFSGHRCCHFRRNHFRGQ